MHIPTKTLSYWVLLYHRELEKGTAALAILTWQGSGDPNWSNNASEKKD